MQTVTVTRTQKWIAQEDGTAPFVAPVDCLALLPPAPGDSGDGRGDAVAALVRETIPEDGQEHLFVLALDTHGKPLARSIVATGSVDQCPLFGRDVFAWALTVPRVRFVGVAHNHPSGDVTPSGPDSSGSSVLAKLGQMLGLDLAWSMVVTHESKDWALVPIRKSPQPGEREPYQPKDPDEDKPEDEKQDEDGGEESEDKGDGEDEESEDGDSSPDGEDGEDGPEDPEGEDEEAPDSTPDPDGTPGHPDVDGTPGRPSTAHPTATIDEVKAALAKALGLKV